MAAVMIPTIKHTCGGPKFGRLAPAGQCARCDELRAGAQPVRWAGAAVFREARGHTTPVYCTCPGTPLWVDRCPTCGKHPYTD